jgi:Cdc6-like AAA superfamily ATPase
MFGKYDADRLFSQYGFNQKQKNDETIINTAKAFVSNEYIGLSRNRLNSGILRNQFLLLLDSLNGKPLSNQTFSGVTQLRADQYVLVHQNRESELWEVYQGNSPNNPRKIYDAITLKNFFDSIQEVVDTTINDVKKDDSGTDNGLGSSLPNFTPSQIIYYGVPGCGKSNKIREQLKNVPEKNKVRVVFHPEYTNAEFIGQILPKVNDHVTYEFTPGPFTQIIKRAYLNPNEHFYLVIEEINRGNAAAIFGDTFQLLDRLKVGETDTLGNDPANAAVNTFTEGWSQYFVQNDDVNAYIRGNENSIQIGNIRLASNTAIRLPPNLSILATMNTSDQNVFTLDNAFQRRFDMELVRNEFDLNKPSVKTQYEAEIDDTGITWGKFWGWINAKITATLKGLSSTEDKRLGVWFVSNIGGVINEKVFAEKVLKYLWDDVFKFKRSKVFVEEIDTLEKLIAAFEKPEQGKSRFAVFKNFPEFSSSGAERSQNEGAANP